MWGYVAASIAGSLLGNSMTNKANLRNTRENNSHQLMMSNTAHQREVKDLKSAGLNPILSARSAGAPVGSSAAAKVEPIKPNVGQALVEAEQIKLLQAQSDKTRAEAVNTKLQEPYNRALADLYSSIAGGAVVTGKALGGAASAVGMYQGAKLLNRAIKSRKARKVDTGKLKDLHKLKTKSRNKFGLRPGEYIDRRTGELKTRFKGKSGGGFSLRKGFGNRSGRYNKFNKF